MNRWNVGDQVEEDVSRVGGLARYPYRSRSPTVGEIVNRRHGHPTLKLFSALFLALADSLKSFSVLRLLWVNIPC
jgi:hypothetical protein